MILAADIGNSNVVIGCIEDGKILFTERLATNRNSTAMEYAVLIKTVLELNGFAGQKFEGGIISSVVPAVTNAMKDAMARLIGKLPMVVGPGLKTGLKIRIDNAAQLGSDRVTDAVAAVEQYPCPLILIDMGTATTISVVDKDKNFIGGLIMPGLRISSEALTSRSSQLPQISLDPPRKAIGRNTVEGMRSGIILGTASTIDGLIDRIEEELGYPCTVVCTGGNSRIVTPHCRHEIIWDDQLLLKGLMYIYHKNI
jgi:type III pantothenate kinase